MLRLDLRVLVEGAARTDGVVPARDPLLADLGFALAEPVRIRGRLSQSGRGRYYWRARLTTVVAGVCRRCLADVGVPVTAELESLFSEDASVGEDPATYRLAAAATHLDLGPTVREELILAVPEYVVCREDCRGLCPRCGRGLNNGPCGCRPEPEPRWAALDALRARWTDREER